MGVKYRNLVESAGRVRRELEITGEEVEKRYGVSKSRQLAQLLYYYARIRAGRDDYYAFELYHPDRSEAEKLKFLTLGQWQRLTDRLNKWSSRSLVFRKSIFASIMRGLDVPTPHEVALTEVRRGASFDEWRRREERALQRIFDAAADGGVVVKPDSQEWGIGILVFTGVSGDSLVRTTGESFSARQLFDAARRIGGRFVAQKRAVAHEALRAFNPTTLPTIRIVTCLENGEPWIPRAAFKLPVGNVGVDNYHAGGYACPIDIATGAVGRGIGKSGFERVGVHPESGLRFEGMVLPFWDSAVALVKRVAPFFYDLRTLGWDLAITSSGPIIIEANYFWGVDIVQRPHGEGLNQGRFRDWYERELGMTGRRAP